MYDEVEGTAGSAEPPQDLHTDGVPAEVWIAIQQYKQTPVAVV